MWLVSCWTQTELHKASGVDKAIISKFVKRQGKFISLRIIGRLAVALAGRHAEIDGNHLIHPSGVQDYFVEWYMSVLEMP